MDKYQQMNNLLFSSIYYFVNTEILKLKANHNTTLKCYEYEIIVPLNICL